MHYERFRSSSSRYIAIAIAFSCMASALADPKIAMSERPVFDGLPFTGITPVQVEFFQNSGPAIHGTLDVTCGDSTISYPVDIPHGGGNHVVTYPDCSGDSSQHVVFDFRSDTERLHQSLSIGNDFARSEIIGQITPGRGDLSFLESTDSARNVYGMTHATYVSPADAPVRAIGYQSLSALIISDDTIGVSDEAVQAIKDWTLQGGTLILMGSPTASVLSDQRWADLLPVTDIQDELFNSSPDLEHRYGALAPGFHAMVGTPVPQATSRAGGLIAERPIGLGRVVYIAFDPLRPPMSDWDGRTTMFQEILSPSEVSGPSIQPSIGVVANPDRVLRGYQAIPNVPYNGAPDTDPFHAKLLDATTVFAVLAAYFLAVVPVNFFVLRKLKRGEFAWATAPIISLAFAGAFFGTARGLYGARLSTYSHGILIAQEGQKDGVAIGFTQLFFPNAGRYDLHLASVDSISSQNFYYGAGPQPSTEGLQPVDNGEVHADMDVPSLSFRQVAFRQKVEAGGWIDFRHLVGSVYQVSNRSPYPLINIWLVGANARVPAGDLKPYATTKVDMGLAVTMKDIPGTIDHILLRSHGLAITGRLEGFRAGPVIGSEVADSMGVQLVYMTNDRWTPPQATSKKALPQGAKG